MKLIIQIPCYNEEKTLPATVADLPRTVAGFDQVEYLVIDDGSADGTSRLAAELGVHHVLTLPRNRGLAHAFSAGLDRALREGADVVVNTDGDNQYCGSDIPRLVRPIIDGEADIVIGARPIEEIADFSLVKKKLQRLGTRVVGALASVKVDDATSGFRAFSREAAKRLLVTSRFTYTLDVIFQAPAKGLLIASTPIRTNAQTRPSRLFRSIPHYIFKSLGTIGCMFAVYKPFLFFSLIGVALFVPGFALGLRFLYFYAHGHGTGHVQSLILAAVLLMTGFQVFLTGVLSHLQATNRRIMEEVLFRLRQHDLRHHGSAAAANPPGSGPDRETAAVPGGGGD